MNSVVGNTITAQRTRRRTARGVSRRNSATNASTNTAIASTTNDVWNVGYTSLRSWIRSFSARIEARSIAPAWYRSG